MGITILMTAIWDSTVTGVSVSHITVRDTTTVKTSTTKLFQTIDNRSHSALTISMMDIGDTDTTTVISTLITMPSIVIKDFTATGASVLSITLTLTSMTHTTHMVPLFPLMEITTHTATTQHHTMDPHSLTQLHTTEFLTKDLSTTMTSTRAHTTMTSTKAHT